MITISFFGKQLSGEYWDDTSLDVLAHDGSEERIWISVIEYFTFEGDALIKTINTFRENGTTHIPTDLSESELEAVCSLLNDEQSEEVRTSHRMSTIE